jgi:general secretion pathway protein L
MPSTLLLRLPPPGAADTEWLLVDASGLPSGPRQRGPLELAAAVAASARVIALVPATQVLLAEPELPPGSGVKLARAVPFALEEQLTEDIDQLVFAVGRRRASGGTPVAVVSRAVLQGWIDTLRAAGIEPAAIHADMALMPENPAQVVLWLEDDRLAVRRPRALPFSVELTPVTEALIVAGVIAEPGHGDADPAGEPKLPDSAILYLTREAWTRVQDEFEGLVTRFESLKVQLLGDGPLPWLAGQLGRDDAVNLLQGEFAAETDYGARWREWRVPAILVLVLLFVHVGAEALQIRAANRRSAQLDSEIAQVFASVMPSEKMTDPRRQMQARLERIRKSAAGPQVFLRAMQALSGAVAALPKTSIGSLSFREQTVDMKVSAPSVDALSQLSQALGSKGMTAEIQSSTPAADGVDAHMQIHTQPAKKRP